MELADAVDGVDPATETRGHLAGARTTARNGPPEQLLSGLRQSAQFALLAVDQLS